MHTCMYVSKSLYDGVAVGASHHRLLPKLLGADRTMADDDRDWMFTFMHVSVGPW
jgi:hypothetical protein